ncbi:PREDICTED: HMG box-containing protein 1 [Rhinopithecus bieti]|uniref:HMG box-containing protein 1 n=1 Tax=Rhinopithecus bieti TaxID=61621 RepID=UPI00083C2F5F|nr:PREDICTED: HMG box-containing protein 1 [Rhinopithecus bieti]
MATGLSEHHNMVWEVKTNQMPNAVQKLLLVMDKRASGMNDSLELLQCNENLPSSPGYNSCDEHMELDDLPELQAVQSDPTQSGMYQLSSDVSHQEYTRPSWNQNTSDIPETTYRENEVDWLTELANIATSPQSPLMQCSFYNRSLLLTSCTSKVTFLCTPSHVLLRRVSQNFPSYPLEGGTAVRMERFYLFHKVLHVMGTSQCFELNISNSFMLCIYFQGYGSDGLKLLSHEESVSFGESVLKLTFDPGTVEDGLLTVECKLDHPFYVKNKGWSSFYPSLTVVQHGIPCCEVHIGDVCLPPGHPDAINFDDSGVFDTFKSYDFTPMDSSAVYVLSSMARQRRASLSCGGPGGQDFARSGFSKNCGSPGSSQLSSNSLYAKAVKNHSSGTVSATSPNKCKRPMNAFMLFAKKYRVEYTQMYPGKDNRAISVILGDRWKKMKNEERRMYTLEAKALAEEQKRLNPDCWKRKRTNSGSQQH